MTQDDKKLELLAKTVAMLSADGVEKANSGHPGLPMGAASYTALLWAEFLRFNPKDTEWQGRDRFILSAGHGSMLLYSMLHLFGYEVSLADLQSFRQWQSITPGHPEFGMTAGVEATTGPLGQGCGNAVGLALSAKLMSESFSDPYNSRVFALVSDGDLMEGIASEAASLAGHLGLGNLIYLYDDNKISLAGSTDVCFTESVEKRFEAYGWHVQNCDAYNYSQIRKTVQTAIDEKERPSIICMRSIIGLGSPSKAGSSEAHGAPLGAGDLAATKKALDWPLDKPFYIPEEIKAFCAECVEEKITQYNQWKQQNPTNKVSFSIPETLKAELASGLGHTKKEATRSLSGKAIQVIAAQMANFIGGSADLEPSTKTLIKNSAEIQKDNFKGRNIRFGVREHAMGAIANGLAYTKYWVPYTATFLVFSDYMRGSIRLAALSHLQTLFVFTHDSFYVGEDGPTHEPIEQIQSLRLIPNLYTYRPADGVEVGMCYYAAIAKRDAPAALLFTRQDLEPITRRPDFSADEVLRGGYVVSHNLRDSIVIVATGSEVSLAIEAAKLLEVKGITARIVSMPCAELFKEQPENYKREVLTAALPVVTLEAGSTLLWSSIIGRQVLSIGIDHYGASAPANVLAEQFGFTPKKVAEKVLGWLNQ